MANASDHSPLTRYFALAAPHASSAALTLSADLSPANPLFIGMSLLMVNTLIFLSSGFLRLLNTTPSALIRPRPLISDVCALCLPLGPDVSTTLFPSMMAAIRPPRELPPSSFFTPSALIDWLKIKATQTEITLLAGMLLNPSKSIAENT